MKQNPALSPSNSAVASVADLAKAGPQEVTVPDIEFAGLKAQYARVREDVTRRIQAVLEHGMFVMGPEIEELEAALATLAGCRHVVGVSSGTDALLAPLIAKSIGPGDAVFLPAFTFTATAEVVMLLGASPVFVDVDPRTFNIDPDDLKARIDKVKAAGTLNPRAVIAVDLFGLPPDYTLLNQICEENDLFLIADAAQSFGGRRDNKAVGTLAPITATSFFPAKPLGCYGDGGAVFTDDETLADLLRSIRIHGQGETKYDIARLGLNARLDSIQAAVLLAKIPIFEQEIEARNRLADLYDARLSDVAVTPARIPGTGSAWAQYSILLDERDRVAADLKEQGIPTAIYYPKPLHLQPAYEGFGEGPGTMPMSEDLCGRIISLPMHPYMKSEVAERITDAVRAAIKGD